MKEYQDSFGGMAMTELHAAERDCVIVKPRPDELFIDIDSEEQMAKFDKAIEVLDRNDSVEGWSKRPSPSGKPGHYHIVVTLGRSVIDEEERVFLQALLGSDSMREMLSYEKIRRGHPAPSVLFEKPGDL